jgi:hypothetical protein
LAAFLLAVPVLLLTVYPRAQNPITGPVSPLPPRPRLQAHPSHDLVALHEQEEQTLTTYGWVDRAKGVVRIPIAEAMRRLAGRGMGAWHDNNASPAIPPRVPAN